MRILVKGVKRIGQKRQISTTEKENKENTKLPIPNTEERRQKGHSPKPSNSLAKNTGVKAQEMTLVFRKFSKKKAAEKRRWRVRRNLAEKRGQRASKRP